jgi:unsaturated chondroitin disaccharide hydrolase
MAETLQTSMPAEALPDGFEPMAARALDFAAHQVETLVRTRPNTFPIFTVDGRWQVEENAWTNWTEGFLGGLVWIFAKRTGDAWWRDRAEHYSRLIEPRQFDRTVHDLGFLFISTWKRWYEIDGDPGLFERVIQAGRTMALRFNENGRYLPSFVAPDSCFIDIMMNVGVIFEAARATGDADLLRIATEHCLTTRRHLVRGDGSTAHEAIFDLETGAFLRPGTHQGWRPDSSWARGQAWALYGFGTAFQLTGDPRFLDTAQRCADFFLDRTGDALVPPNDWEEPNPPRPYESSAAAIAASGLLQLAEIAGDPARRVRYHSAAVAILSALCSPKFLAIETPDWEGVLLHGVYHERKKLGVDESVMWGDYFFVEALERALGTVAGGTAPDPTPAVDPGTGPGER